MLLDISNAVSSSPAQERILLCGKRLFATKGYERTTTSEIARAAQTSESQIMRHFGSKQGLLEAIFDAHWSQLATYLRGRMGELDSPVERVRTAFRVTLSFLDRDPEFKWLLLFEGRRMRADNCSCLLTSGFLSFVAFVDTLLCDLQSRRLVREGVPIHAFRSALMGAAEGLLRDRLLAESGVLKADYHLDDTSRVFDLLLATLLVRQSD